MKYMKHGLFALIVLTSTFSTYAQVRTWAFDKDTVYEWAPNGDSVSLANTGTDTLKFDSISLELLRPTATHFQVQFSFPGLNYQYMMEVYQGNTTQSKSLNKMVVAPGQSGKAVGFRVEDALIRAAKSSAMSQGDTLVVRMIFWASGSRGRDTLILNGKQDLPAALRSFKDKVKSQSPGARYFDPRGRRVETIPEGIKAPWTPLVSPRE